ncbi:MAG: 3-oxoacyl-ACP reductase FabG [Pyrinomonadaceae bacterium]
MLIHDMGLFGRVALITGGSRGIGRSLAIHLAKAGVRVAISYHSDDAAAQEVVRLCVEAGCDALAVKGELANVDDAANIVNKCYKKFNRLDYLICNAGIWEGGAVEDISEELWDRVIDVNLKGTWAVCKAAVPIMKRQGSGRIVVVSSTAGQRGEAFVANYAASKGGQISFVKSLAVELAPSDITVNAVAPGWVETEMNREVFADAKFRDGVTQAIPLRRIASPDDIALPIMFLCSNWARHITGEVLNINGGSVLCG